MLALSVALAVYLFAGIAKVNTDLEKELGTHAAAGSSGHSKSFTFKITVKAVDANSEMGKMKVKVTVKDKDHASSSDKGRTQSKTVDIGKQALYWDDSEFIVGKFEFKNTHKGDWYIVCIANMCKDTEQIKSSKSVLDVFSVGWAGND